MRGSVCLSIFFSLTLTLSLSLSLSVCLSVRLSVCLSLPLTVCATQSMARTLLYIRRPDKSAETYSLLDTCVSHKADV
jgi:hypothetical protein